MLVKELLDGQYEILQSLGEGGMGETFLALDIPNGRSQCVVKRLKPSEPNNLNFISTARRLFQQEVSILQQLGSHSRIPKLLGHFEQDNQFYIVQEYIEGHSLSSELQLGDRWTEANVINLLSELLPVVEFLHQNNVIHRDIKPQNIIRRSSDSSLVLIDFGAVKEVCLPPNKSGHLSLTVAIGTPGYMPMEQAAGKPRYCSDLYALGMVAIQALTGLLPSQLREDVDGEFIWQPFADVSDDFAQFLSKLVRHYFKDRPKTAVDAQQQLRSLLNKRSTSNNAGFNHIAVQLPVSPQYYQGYPSQSLLPPNTPYSSQGSTPPSLDSHTNQSVLPTEATAPAAPNYSKHAVSKRPVQWIAATTAASVMVLGLSGFLGYRQWSHQTQSHQLEDIEALLQQNNYKDCAEQASQFSGRSDRFIEQAAQLMAQCQEEQADTWLVEANQNADANSFLSAISVANQVTPETPDQYAIAQDSITDWSQNIIESAQNQYQQGAKDIAIAWLNNIPSNNSAYSDAQQAIAQWTAEWDANESHLEAARQAANRNDPDPDKAFEHLDQIRMLGEPVSQDSKYWKENVRDVWQQAVDAQEILDQRNRASAAENEIDRLSPTLEINDGWLHLDNPDVYSLGRDEGNRLAQNHSITVSDGQTVRIEVDSEFDSVVYIINPENGRVLAEADDYSIITENFDAQTNLDAMIPRYTFYQSGTYHVRVVGYSSREQGNYQLTVRTID